MHRVDPQVQSLLDRWAAQGALPVVGRQVDEVRREVEAGAAALFGPVDEVAVVEDRTVPGPAGQIPVRVYRPQPDAEPLPVLVYLHGGGWVVGSLDSHDGICRALARRAGCVVVSVDYRLAPEHRFPAALEDAWAGTAWVAEHAAEVGGDAAALAIAGDSAGGNLAAVVALRARDRGLPLVFQLLVYPVTDHYFDTSSYLELAEGFSLTRAAMQWYWGHYLGSEGDGTNHEASPLRASELAGVAPALVLTAELNPLRDEGEAYALRLEEAGVPATLVRYDGVIHGFLRMAADLDRAREALDEVSAALRRACSPVQT